MSHSCNFISHTTYHPMIYLAIRFISHNCNFIPPNVNSYLTIVNLFLLILTLNVTMRFCVSHLQLHITYVFVFHNCNFVSHNCNLILRIVTLFKPYIATTFCIFYSEAEKGFHTLLSKFGCEQHS